MTEPEKFMKLFTIFLGIIYSILMLSVLLYAQLVSVCCIVTGSQLYSFYVVPTKLGLINKRYEKQS